MNIALALQKMYPQAVPGVDYTVADDGAGMFIKEWNLPGSMPTHEAMAAAEATAVLASAKDDGLLRVAAYARSIRVKVAGTADEIEISGWTNKLRIAQAFKAGTATAQDTAAFQAEIDARGLGETMDSFSDKVLNNAAFFGRAVGKIDGIKRATEDAIKAAVSAPQVEQIISAAKTLSETELAALLQSR